LQPVTVCEVLKDLGSYDGKVVAVVGRFSYRQTGRWLGEQKCDLKPPSGDREWPDKLRVVYNPASGPKPPPVWAVDGTLLGLKLRKVKQGTTLGKFRFGSPDYDIWAVVYGRIETDKQTVQTAEGERRNTDSAESSPAQLVCHGDAVVVFLSDDATTPSSR
jgi:hypothetical protein